MKCTTRLRLYAECQGDEAAFNLLTSPQLYFQDAILNKNTRHSPLEENYE